MYQKMIAIGRLTKDPETKYFDGDKSVTRFSLAVNSGFGENQDTTFFNCSAWNKTGKNIESFTKKGSLVAVEGTMRSNKHEDKIYWELSVSQVRFLDSRNDAPQNNNQGQNQGYQAPNQGYNQTQQPFQGASNSPFTGDFPI